MDRRQHWEHVYTTRADTEVSWFQREPLISLRLIEALAPANGSVIDVGGGASLLVDGLLERGFTDLTVLDISDHALDRVRERLGDRGRLVTLLRRDVVAWEPDRTFDIWHDRAVFHFLTDPAARDRYVANATRAVRRGGALVVATFAEDGPVQCSGLPVSRWSAPALEAAFSPRFSPLGREREEHVTPAGVVQPFTWVALRRA